MNRGNAFITFKQVYHLGKVRQEPNCRVGRQSLLETKKKKHWIKYSQRRGDTRRQLTEVNWQLLWRNSDHVSVNSMGEVYVRTFLPGRLYRELLYLRPIIASEVKALNLRNRHLTAKHALLCGLQCFYF